MEYYGPVIILAIIAMVLYGLNAVIAAVFVGRFVGEEALAGVSVAYPLTQISLGLGSLIGVGAGSALSLALGRQDKEMQKRLMGNVNYLSILVTLIYMVLGLLFSTQLVRIMGGEGETLALGDSYFRITVIGSFFWIYGLAANMIVRAEGKMKSAAVVMGIGLAVDVLSNYILVSLAGFWSRGSCLGYKYRDAGLHLAGMDLFWQRICLIPNECLCNLSGCCHNQIHNWSGNVLFHYELYESGTGCCSI